MSVVANQIARINKPVFRYLDTVGDGSGLKNAVQDYSSTPGRFLIKPAENEIYLLHHLIINLEVVATIDNSGFGRFTAPLTNGISVRLRDKDDNIIVDLTDGVPMQTTFDIGKYATDAVIHNFGEANDLWVVKWDLTDSGQPLIVDGRPEYGHSLNVELADDFSSEVVTLSFLARGRENAWLTDKFA